ncbi:MAG: hypothetical protein QM669_00055 [Siphonobacter sp.]
MKKILSVLAISLITFSTFSASATSEPVKSNTLNAQVAQDVNLRFQLTFQNPDKQKLTVVIKDKENLALFTETTTNANYLRLFDLSTLADGKYTLEVTGGAEHFSKTFELATQTSRMVLARN